MLVSHTLLDSGHVRFGLAPQKRAIVIDCLHTKYILRVGLQASYLEAQLLALVHVLNHTRAGGHHELVALDAIRVLGGRPAHSIYVT